MSPALRHRHQHRNNNFLSLSLSAPSPACKLWPSSPLVSTGYQICPVVLMVTVTFFSLFIRVLIFFLRSSCPLKLSGHCFRCFTQIHRVPSSRQFSSCVHSHTHSLSLFTAFNACFLTFPLTWLHWYYNATSLSLSTHWWCSRCTVTYSLSLSAVLFLFCFHLNIFITVLFLTAPVAIASLPLCSVVSRNILEILSCRMIVHLKSCLPSHVSRAFLLPLCLASRGTCTTDSTAISNDHRTIGTTFTANWWQLHYMLLGMCHSFHSTLTDEPFGVALHSPSLNNHYLYSCASAFHHDLNRWIVLLV